MAGTISHFLSDEGGATAIEYAMIAALIATALIATFIVFGNSLAGLFGYVRDRSIDAMGG
ncbi:MAG: Flp family type IVb pilin [Devosia sp.]